ncbi:MAG: acyl-CoA synthetase [Paracoccaceae bacterium]|jgi:fatty-acyl-CoA synthase|nr:acyl-CoA synthetase [Paracoccaceae bacterium]
MTTDWSASPGSIARPSWRVMNLGTLLSQTARRLPDRPGIVWGERQWSWGQIEARVAALSAGLRGMGLGKGDRVLVHARNSHTMLEVMFATFRIGAVFVPTNFRLLPDEVIYLAEMSGAVLFICDDAFPDHARTIAEAVPGVRHHLAIGGNGPATVEGLIAANEGAAAPAEPVLYDDPCWFFFTSGTTGRSKASVLTHGQMAFIVTNHLADLMPGNSESDASLVVAPLSHGAGVHALSQVARGAISILPEGDRFDVAEAWRLVAEWRVSNAFTVPTILKMMVEHPSAATADTASLRHVIYAGAPMYRADQKAILDRLGNVIVQYFGLGEVTGCITVLPARLHTVEDGPEAREGTCGYDRTGVEVSIQDDEGRHLEPFQTGEICVVGPAVFAGYWNNPEANAKSFRDGWFSTGDLGHRDEQGFVYITGRASDMYISGGSNIYPREIEEKILTHPDIVEVAVLGMPDPKWGEIGVAVVVLRAGATMDEADFMEWLTPKIARYKLPRRVFFWDALPKSGYGKIPKRMVRDEIEARGLMAPV